MEAFERLTKKQLAVLVIVDLVIATILWLLIPVFGIMLYGDAILEGTYKTVMLILSWFVLFFTTAFVSVCFSWVILPYLTKGD